MIRALLIALALVAWAIPAAAQMTCDGANFAWSLNTASAAPTLALPTSAPVGATIVVGVQNRTDETTTITSVADGANGAYTVSAPADNTAGTIRSWTAYFLNNGSNAAHTVTITFSGSISSQFIVGWCSDTGGAQTFDSAATPADNGVGTTHNSNSVTMDGAGGIVGFVVPNNAVTFTADGAGESNIEGGGGGQRITAFFQAVSGAGSEGLLSTSSGSTASNFHVLGFLSPGGGGGGGRPKHRCTLLGVCE